MLKAAKEILPGLAGFMKELGEEAWSIPDKP